MTLAPAGTPWQLRLPRLPRASTPAAVAAPAAGPTVTAPVALPGNLLPPADSDFESAATGNWRALSNETARVSTAQQFSGGASLEVTANDTGVGEILYTPYLACVPGNPYDVSAQAFTLETGRTATLAVHFYGAGGTYLSSWSVSVPMTAGAWVPLVTGFTPPQGAVSMRPLAQVNSMAAGESAWWDLFYAAQAQVQVLIAFGSSPLSASPVWTDVTPFVRADAGIRIQRGRSDEVSAVQPGTLTFTLDNSVGPGWFAQGNPGSPFGASFTLGKRVQVNFADENGVYHTRADMYLSRLATSWQGGPGLSSLTQVTAQDLLSWLSRDTPMRTMIEQEILADSPLVLYTLADATAALGAADSSGNGAPPLQKAVYGTGSGSSMTFGSSGAIIGAGAFGFSTASGTTSSPLPAVQWVAGTNEAIVLQGELPEELSSADGFTVECWYSYPSALSSYGMFGLVNTTTWQQIAVIWPGDGYVEIVYFDQSGTQTARSSGTIIAETGPLFLTVSGATATVYSRTPTGIAAVVSLTLPEMSGLNSVTVGGGITVRTEAIPLNWNGQLNCFAVYPGTILTTTRMGAHLTAGWNQNQGQLVSTLVANILRYAGIPTWAQDVATGASYADAYEITGQSPLSMIQIYQGVDGGVLFATAGGVVTWQDRTARYGAQAHPALILTPGQYEPTLSAQTSSQYMINDETNSSPDTPGGIRQVNTGSETAAGPYPSGSPSAPNIGNWLTTPYNANLTVGDSGYDAAPDPTTLTDAADWAVNVYGTPAPRPSGLTIDLMAPETGLSRAAVFGVDIGAVVQLDGLPSTAPGGLRANMAMTEGVSDTYQVGSTQAVWTVELATSPAQQQAAWLAGDPVMGVLDSTAVVGRGTDGSLTSGTGWSYQYSGPPYPVPTFSATMNQTGSVGANDMRGLAYNVQQAVTPPLAIALQATTGQSFASGVAAAVEWDTLWADTAGGWALPTSAISYVVQVPGNYLLMAQIVFATSSATGDIVGWLTQNGAQAGLQVRQPSAATGAHGYGLYVEAQITAAKGDLLQVMAEQTSGSAVPLAKPNNGYFTSQFSILFVGT